MATLRALLERRASIADQMKALHAPHEGKALPEAEERQFAALRAELEPLTQAIDRQALIDELDRRAGGTPLDGGGDTSFDKLASQVSVLDVVRAQMGDTSAASGRAREVSQELEKRSGRPAQGLYFNMGQARPETRVFSTTLPAGGPGGALVQTDVSPNLIDRLREKIVVRALGATVLTGLQGNLSIPRLKASASGQWVAENTPITVSDPQTDGVPLTPKHVGGIVEISRNMVQQPSLDVSRMVEDDLSKVIAVAIDAAALVGGGANQPSGLLSASSGITIVPIAAAGGVPTWDTVIALVAAVDTSNALGGSLAFATNAKAVSKMRRTLKSTADTASNFLQIAPNELAGYPLASTQLVPSNGTKSTGSNLSALIFGDWSGLILGFWSELDILVNPYESTAYSKGNIQIRGMATADVGIKHPLGFSAATDMVTV